MSDTLFPFLRKYLTNEKVNLDFGEFKLQLQGHPYYPSLNSIVGALNHFDVKNYVVQLETSEENFDNLPERFITKTENSRSFVLVNKKKQYVILTNENLNTKRLSKKEFFAIWQGLVLFIDENNKRTSPIENISNVLSLKKILPIVLTLCLTFLVAYIVFQIDRWSFKFQYFLSLMGLYVSYLIINAENGKKNAITRKVCGESKTSGCNSIIQSKTFKLPFNISLGDLSLIYFSTLGLLWSLSPLLTFEKSILFYLSILTIPVTIFSIVYQKFIANSWCRLCLILVGVLWFQFGIFSTSFDLSQLFVVTQIDSVLWTSFILISLGVLWISAKRHITKYQQLINDKVTLLRLKSNFRLFKLALSQENKISKPPSFITENEIKLGNPNAVLELTFVTNPTCSFCKEAYATIKEILKKYSDEVLISVRFSVDVRNEENLGYRTAHRLLVINWLKTINDKSSITDVLGYEESALNSWLKSFVAINDKESKAAHQLLNAQKNWCAENNIYFTPFLLVNQLPFPKEYEIPDILFLIEELIDFYNNEFQLAI